MATSKDEASCDSDLCEKEYCTTPKPFKEPDGMVTIDLNRKSSVPLEKPQAQKAVKFSTIKILCYMIAVLLISLTSFSIALFIHWKEFFYKPNFMIINNQSSLPINYDERLYVTPAPEKLFKSKLKSTNILENYEEKLILCKITKTYEDCCEIFSNIYSAEINQLCNVEEMLEILHEIKNEKNRYKRNIVKDTTLIDDNENLNNENTEQNDKLLSNRNETKEKLLTYFDHLSQSNKEQLISLLNWIQNILKNSDNLTDFSSENLKFNKLNDSFENEDQISKTNFESFSIYSDSSLNNQNNSHNRNQKFEKPESIDLMLKIYPQFNQDNLTDISLSDISKEVYSENQNKSKENQENNLQLNNSSLIETKKQNITIKKENIKSDAILQKDRLKMFEDEDEPLKHLFEGMQFSSSPFFRKKREDVLSVHSNLNDEILMKDNLAISKNEANKIKEETRDKINHLLENVDFSLNPMLRKRRNHYDEYQYMNTDSEINNMYPSNRHQFHPDYFEDNESIEESDETNMDYHNNGMFDSEYKNGKSILHDNTPIFDQNQPQPQGISNYLYDPAYYQNINNQYIPQHYLQDQPPTEQHQNQNYNVQNGEPYNENYVHDSSYASDHMKILNDNNNKKPEYPVEYVNKYSEYRPKVEYDKKRLRTENILNTNEWNDPKFQNREVELAKEFINSNMNLNLNKTAKQSNYKNHGIINIDLNNNSQFTDIIGSSNDNNPTKLDKPVQKKNLSADINNKLTNNKVLPNDISSKTSIFSIKDIKAKNKSLQMELNDTNIELGKHETDKFNSKIRGNDITNDLNTKLNSFPTNMENFQNSPQNFVNPCIYTYPVGVGNRFATYDSNPMFNVISANGPKYQQSSPIYVINPSMFSYSTASSLGHYSNMYPNYNSYSFINPSSNAPVQVTGSNGQYYVCNPIPNPLNNNIASIPGIEIRRNSNLQELIKDFKLEKQTSNQSRAALQCPFGEQSCLDGSKCISERLVCDNEVHCDDGSDEMFCSCRERIGDLRLCDGYFDCPNGEDEQGCFGCSENEISCDDWSRFRKGTCVSIEQRCDGIRQCEITGKDEEDCSILTDGIEENNLNKISNAVGYLHRNYKGKWYPTCFGSELWAMDVCKTESGPSIAPPKSHLVLTMEKYNGDFINILPNNEISLVNTCVQDRATFVECPPIFCGLRMITKNPYRPQEVDTEMEDIVNHISRSLVEDTLVGLIRNISDPSKLSSVNPESARVVGGKPSQPAAWPWVVSIYKNGIFHCGGVIINELWILTAAHCVDKYWQFYYEIQAGILRRFSYCPMDQTRFAVAAIPHEDYDKSNLKNDIALMKLSAPVRYNRFVRPICLPSEVTAGRDFHHGPAPGTICTTVGWGATIEHGADPDHMREVEVPVLKSCKHKEDKEGNEICAGLFEGGKDACQGDSGGPFMCQNPNNPSQWYLAGIVSHGEGCARPDEPGVYTRVSQYIEWITHNTRDRTFFPRSPLSSCPGFVCKGTRRCIPKKRHCDRIVDCLFGDDELNCENSYHTIFKHSRRNLINLFRNSDEKDPLLKASIITAADDIENTILENLLLIHKENNENLKNFGRKYLIFNQHKNNTAHPNIFKCERLLQLIPIEKRCDKQLDCEDGSDELNCTCVDYLWQKHSHAICDGIMDCADFTDEKYCESCTREEFNCRQSQKCIPLKYRCDGKVHCSNNEDELDCIALTNGATLKLDSERRPSMTAKGIVAINRHGQWHPYCANSINESIAIVATNVCNYLGFQEYTGFRKYLVKNITLRIANANSEKNETNLNETNDRAQTCNGVFLWCSNVTLNKETFINSPGKLEYDAANIYTAPWNAAIFANGNFKCMGTILDSEWILTSLYCFDDILNYKTIYMTVLLGKGKRNIDVPSHREVTRQVIKTIRVGSSDIVLLRMAERISFGRYIQPTHLKTRNEQLWKEKCLLVGVLDGGTKYLTLSSNKTCHIGKKCFNQLELQTSCEIKDQEQNDHSWSGTITCDSGNGWYPAAVFHSKYKYCKFSHFTSLTNVRYWTKEILTAMANTMLSIPAFHCEGFRCKLGTCLPKKEICDGIPQCRYAEDEDSKMCENQYQSCHLTNNCVCPPDHLTCKNGKCVPKDKYCDKNDDCGDNSDEPKMCSYCKNYMELAHPDKLCDGIPNCEDRGDESIFLCNCKSDDFKCNKHPNQCVPSDTICDGIQDCLEGEDEKNCYAFSKNLTSSNSGEVKKIVAGKQFYSCFQKPPSQQDMDMMCQMFGFVGALKSSLLNYPSNVIPAETTINSNIYQRVWLRRNTATEISFALKTGNDDYLKQIVKQKENVNCKRLWLECI